MTTAGYQPRLKTIAARLNREWSFTPVRVHFIEDYYRVTQTAYVEALRAKGLSDLQIGTHAGTLGDPRKATAALGELGAELIVTRTVDAIKAAQARH